MIDGKEALKVTMIVRKRNQVGTKRRVG